MTGPRLLNEQKHLYTSVALRCFIQRFFCHASGRFAHTVMRKNVGCVYHECTRCMQFVPWNKRSLSFASMTAYAIGNCYFLLQQRGSVKQPSNCCNYQFNGGGNIEGNYSVKRRISFHSNLGTTLCLWAQNWRNCEQLGMDDEITYIHNWLPFIRDFNQFHSRRSSERLVQTERYV